MRHWWSRKLSGLWLRIWGAGLLSGSIALLSACATSSTTVNEKRALVIGNANYSVVTPLVNPINDEEDVCKTLRDLDFKPSCHTNVGTRAEFETLVQDYVTQLGPNSAGLFYYSGHGVQAGGQNFLVPTGAQVGGDDANPLKDMYPINDLFEKLKGKRTAPVFQMIVLDACRSDPFAEPPPDSTRSRSVALAAKRDEMKRSLEVVANASYGLAKIDDAPVGSIVLFATGSRDTAYDGLERHGPLTEQFLKQIKQRGLNVEDLLKNVISGVQDETTKFFHKTQTPFTYSSFRGQFCFAGCFNPDDFTVPVTP